MDTLATWQARRFSQAQRRAGQMCLLLVLVALAVLDYLL